MAIVQRVCLTWTLGHLEMVFYLQKRAKAITCEKESTDSAKIWELDLREPTSESMGSLLPDILNLAFLDGPNLAMPSSKSTTSEYFPEPATWLVSRDYWTHDQLSRATAEKPGNQTTCYVYSLSRTFTKTRRQGTHNGRIYITTST